METIDRSFYTVSEDTRQLINALKMTREAFYTYTDATEKIPFFGDYGLRDGSVENTNKGRAAFGALWDSLFLCIRHSIENHLQLNGMIEHPENEI